MFASYEPKLKLLTHFTAAIPITSVVCLACGLPEKPSFHFGGSSCTACASFFRRTVSLNIRYVCKRENKCISTPELRSICRSCRYQSCVYKAGLQRDLVQPRRNDKRTPKYILDSRKDGECNEVVRDYTTNSYTTLHECTSESTESTTSSSCYGDDDEEMEVVDIEEGSKILNLSNDELLQFYVRQTESAYEKIEKNSLNIQSVDELITLSCAHHEVATQLVATCPGVDLLEKGDLDVFFNYCLFVSTWLDSTWLFSHVRNGKHDAEKLSGSNDPLYHFIFQMKSSSLAQLKLNLIEYSALKSFCIWKLNVHEPSLTMKIVAQEHYLGVTSALRDYYQSSTNLESFEIATRIAEITLQIAPIFEQFREMMQLYKDMSIAIVVPV